MQRILAIDSFLKAREKWEIIGHLVIRRNFVKTVAKPRAHFLGIPVEHLKFRFSALSEFRLSCVIGHDLLPSFSSLQVTDAKIFVLNTNGLLDEKRFYLSFRASSPVICDALNLSLLRFVGSQAQHCA